MRRDTVRASYSRRAFVYEGTVLVLFVAIFSMSVLYGGGNVVWLVMRCFHAGCS